MKGIAFLAAAAAMVNLAGCNRLGLNANASANAAAGNAASGNAAAKPADGGGANQAGPQAADAGKLNAGGGAIPASSSGTVQLDRTYIMGRWTDDDDCSKAIEFTQDGRFIAMDGTTGLWNLEGNRLTVSGQSTLTFRISPIDQNIMTVINDDNSLSRSTRC
jgi:hypothetical protein